MQKYLIGASLAAIFVAAGLVASLSWNDVRANWQSSAVASGRPATNEVKAQISDDFQETMTVLPSATESPKALGDGHSPVQVYPSLGTAFEQNLPRVTVKINNPKPEFTFQLVSSARTYDEAMGVNTEVNAHYVFASAKGKINIDRASSNAESSLRLVVTAQMNYGDDEIVNPTLHTQAKALIEQGRHVEFQATYGSHFVWRQQRIHKIMIIISADSWTLKADEVHRVAINGKLDFGVGGGDLKVRVSNDLHEAARRKAVNVEVKMIGGTGLQDIAGLIPPILSNPGEDFFASLDEKLRKVLIATNRETSGIGQVIVRSYREFGWQPTQTLWNQRLESSLQQLAEEYRRGTEHSRHLRNIERNATDLTQLGAYIKTFDTYLVALADRQQSLLASDVCATDAATWPVPPSMPGELTIRLVAYTSTIESRMNVKVITLQDQISVQKSVSTTHEANLKTLNEKTKFMSIVKADNGHEQLQITMGHCICTFGADGNLVVWGGNVVWDSKTWKR